MTTITSTTNKDEIVSNACELIDSQADTISQLQQQSKTLFFALALSLAWQLLF